MTAPVTKARIATAGRRLQNADVAAIACREAGLPFFVACALLEKESGGRNVYGHDVGGTFSGFPKPVNRWNFEAFRWLVIDKGQASNGVGPCQITYRGYFPAMESEGLKPWDAHDNMLYGFRLLKANYDHTSSWSKAGAIYNGGPTPSVKAQGYGRDLAAKVAAWKQLLGIGS